MHLMTWIIVAAIEQLISAVNRQPNIDINIYDDKNKINCTIDEKDSTSGVVYYCNKCNEPCKLVTLGKYR
jgi:hypothetical protein